MFSFVFTVRLGNLIKTGFAVRDRFRSMPNPQNGGYDDFHSNLKAPTARKMLGYEDMHVCK